MYRISFRQTDKKTQVVYSREEPRYFLCLLSYADIEYLLVEKVEEAGEDDGIVN